MARYRDDRSEGHTVPMDVPPPEGERGVATEGGDPCPLVDGDLVQALEAGLPAFLSAQRWFSGKARRVARTAATVHDLGGRPRLLVCAVEVEYAEGTRELYQVPVSMRAYDDPLLPPLERLEIAHLEAGSVVAYDALSDPEAPRRLLELTAVGRDVAGLAFENLAALDAAVESVRPVGTEQSNTSLVFDERVILKWFRQAQPGVHPELEVPRALAGAGFAHVARPLGAIVMTGGVRTTLAVVQEFYAGAEDGWTTALESASGAAAGMEEGMRDLGRVTADLHLALGSLPGDGFGAEPVSSEDLERWAVAMTAELDTLFVSHPESDLGPLGARRDDVVAVFDSLRDLGPAGRRIRVHGDLHLGQVIRHEGRWVVLDFEGEPAVPLEQRRARTSPLVDVAGMLRSIDYAADARDPGSAAADPGWAALHRHAFLSGYRAGVAGSDLVPESPAFEVLLAALELRKAVYELGYELGARPSWAGIPLRGITRILQTAAAGALGKGHPSVSS